MEFLVGIRPVVYDHETKASHDNYNSKGEYLPKDPQPAVTDAHLAFVTAEDAAEAAELYIRSRGPGSRTSFPTTLVVIGPGADITVDIGAIGAQDPAPAPA